MCPTQAASSGLPLFFLLHLTYAQSDTCCYSGKSSFILSHGGQKPPILLLMVLLMLCPIACAAWVALYLECEIYLGVQRIIPIVPGVLDQHNCKPETFQLKQVISGSCKHLQAECGERNNHKPPAAHETGSQQAKAIKYC